MFVIHTKITRNLPINPFGQRFALTLPHEAGYLKSILQLPVADRQNSGNIVISIIDSLPL